MLSYGWSQEESMEYDAREDNLNEKEHNYRTGA